MSRAASNSGRPRIKAAILGCTGLVGQHFVRLLADHPDFEIAALAASPRSAGRPYGEAAFWAIGGTVPGEEVARIVEPLDGTAGYTARGITIAFSALPAAAAGPIETALGRDGCAVFTNASAHRRDADVPILIPEINPGHLELVHPLRRRRPGFIAAGSNCSTAGLALALAPLRAFGIRRVSCVTFQSASGAGRRGLAALEAGPPNIIPFIKDEEDKMAFETAKIFGLWTGGAIEPAPFTVEARCARVPVREGHLLSVSVDLARETGRAEVEAAIGAFGGWPRSRALPTSPARPLILRHEPDRPQPALDLWAGGPGRAAGMAVTVGRLEVEGRSVRLFALVHNLVRGAAGLCVLNAEAALRQGVLEGATS
jgi:aspartate-semialdehyde dehydrogenase